MLIIPIIPQNLALIQELNLGQPAPKDKKAEYFVHTEEFTEFLTLAEVAEKHGDITNDTTVIVRCYIKVPAESVTE